VTELVAFSSLEQSGALTRVGLLLPVNITDSEYEALGFALGEAQRSIQFAIGDYILAGEHLFGQEAYQLQESLGISVEQRRQYVRVSERIPIGRRRVELTWSHHREVAAMDPADQDAWLEDAVTNGWNKQELASHMKPDTPTEREVCPQCGRPL